MGEGKKNLNRGGEEEEEGRGDDEKKNMMADFGLGGEKIWLGPWGCGGLGLVRPGTNQEVVAQGSLSPNLNLSNV